MSMNFLFIAYTLIWLALCMYLLRLGRKIKTMEKEIEQLQER